MASIKSRVATLEQASKAATRRPMADAELAVRVAHILNHPASSPVYGPLREFMKRTLVNKVQPEVDVHA